MVDWGAGYRAGDRLVVHGRPPVDLRSNPHALPDSAFRYLFSAYYQGGTFPDERGWNRNVMRDPRVRLKIGDRLFDQTVSHVTDAETHEAVHASFVAKYPEWSSPGLENVHILLVED